jgi:cellulose biosynthesis protein BcsQ
VLIVDFDPQATISHAMGIVDVPEDLTVWGIIARDLIHETRRMNAEFELCDSEERVSFDKELLATGIGDLDDEAFISKTCWPSIDIIGSCANAAFVEFATAQYRVVNSRWSFFAAVDRFLARLSDDRYDLIIFDCPPAIGYQSLNAIFAADVLYIPTGPGYWEYDSTTSFMAQLGEALLSLEGNAEKMPQIAHQLPKEFQAIRVVLTRYEPSNELHESMKRGLKRCFDEWVTQHPIEHTRAVDQTGRFLQSVYEIDYRKMTRETWRRARRSFDAAYGEFKGIMLEAWEKIPESRPSSTDENEEAA